MYSPLTPPIISATLARMSLKKLYIQTHGCQMNEYDSSSIVNVLKHSHAVELTQNPEEADILLMNTCSIREKPQEKVFSELGVWRELKKKRPDVILGVGGCVASQEGEGLRQRAPYVDLVFGPQTLHRLPEMINAFKEKGRPVVDVSFPEIEKFDHLPKPSAEGPKAFVSIMEGCNKYCSYCIVPYTRGEEISRPFDDVIAEVACLAEQGVREVTLLGQNVNDYRGPKHDGGTADLAELIDLIAAMDNIARIRFTTSHPLAFSDRLIQAYADNPKLADHLHLPVQSGSDRILSLMKRGYTAKDYLIKIEKLRKVRPNISISTDFIIGFPSETDADFEASLELNRQVVFDHSFSFIYSARPGTPAARLADTIPMEVKKERLKILQSRIEQQTIRISHAMQDTQQNVLVDGVSKNDPTRLTGKTENNRFVYFTGDANLIGTLVPVRITQAKSYSLEGERIL